MLTSFNLVLCVMSSQSSGECPQLKDAGTEDEQNQSLQQQQQHLMPEGDGEGTGVGAEVKKGAGNAGGRRDAGGCGTGVDGGVEEEQSSGKQVQQPHQQTEGGDAADLSEQVSG